MVKRFFLAASIAGALATFPAHAVDMFSGNYLLPLCQSKVPTENVTCMSYIRGVRDGMDLQQLMTQSQLFYCVPQGVTLGQSKDIFVKYLVDNPNDRHMPGSTLLAVAYIKAFPCKGKK
ncbi:Rap1a/Tai family immunity protein [Achromobacter sp. NFACC18-2]|uniref:Rap1a/Tai family immunity protein n=1 Tax=Achromobacter sp. NFACC18-2 TaxID=1564112 RepID=UPI0008B27F64|nr:hypothetical protein SAMN03159494_00982 [Achromobacter sp. NFACC18-2]